MSIIVINAWSKETDKTGALNAGTDGYLTRPFSMEELLARPRATLRRLSYYTSSVGAETSVFENGGLRIDHSAGCTYLGDEELHSTPMGYRLLHLLAENVDRVLAHPYTTKGIWGNSWNSGATSLRVFMATLRRKPKKDEGSPQYIQTHVGIDYRVLQV